MKSRGLLKSEIPENVIPKFWSRVRVGQADECWPWIGTFRNKGKYGQIGFNHRYHLAHVVAFALVNGDLMPGECSLHKCDNPPCCNPDHLFRGTKADNNKDREIKGRGADKRGESNGRAKLSVGDVKSIRLKAINSKYRDIATDYGVSTVLIAKIARGELWRHIH